MAEKKSFMLYFDNEQQFNMLTDEQAGKLIKSLFRFAKNGEIPEFTDGMIKMAFSFITSQIQRDLKKYDEKCERNRKIAIEREAKKRERNSTNVFERERTYTKCTYTDTDKDTDTISGSKPPEPPVGAGDLKKSKKNGLQEIINAYSDNPEIREAIEGFVEMRKKIKKPLTERALNIALNKLKKLADTDEMKIAVVDQSIEHGWQTFYEFKGNLNQNNVQNEADADFLALFQ